MKYNSFEDMPVLINAIEIAKIVFDYTASLPRNEDYGLTSQIRRSAVSISANIAEGYGRGTGPDKNKFYVIARGSAFETKSHLIYGYHVGYFNKNQMVDLASKIEQLVYELNKLSKSIAPKPQP